MSAETGLWHNQGSAHSCELVELRTQIALHLKVVQLPGHFFWQAERKQIRSKRLGSRGSFTWPRNFYALLWRCTVCHSTPHSKGKGESAQSCKIHALMIGLLLCFAYFWGKSIFGEALFYHQLLLLQAIYAVVAVQINPQKRSTFSAGGTFSGTLQQCSNVFIV